MNTGSLFSKIPGALPEEVFEELATGNGVKIERIISKGHRSPDNFWYDQPQNEWVLVIRGAARLQIWGQKDPVTLSAGMYTNLPAHVKHRVEWTQEDEETIWLAVFY
ncbi:cupin domain-containing protein [Larkinella harenae]